MLSVIEEMYPFLKPVHSLPEKETGKWKDGILLSDGLERTVEEKGYCP